MPISVLDVAAYILKKTGPITAMKLQKLCYYSQAWHLVWEEEPLFPERFEAWANGPVAPELYKVHRGEFKVEDVANGNPNLVSEDEKARTTVDGILATYQNKSGAELSVLTHREKPWKSARGDLLPGERSHAVIADSAMAEFYASLL